MITLTWNGHQQWMEVGARGANGRNADVPDDRLRVQSVRVAAAARHRWTAVPHAMDRTFRKQPIAHRVQVIYIPFTFSFNSFHPSMLININEKLYMGDVLIAVAAAATAAAVTHKDIAFSMKSQSQLMPMRLVQGVNIQCNYRKPNRIENV